MINLLMLFKNIIAVFTVNHTKPISKSAASVTVKANGMYRYRLALKG
jgi:hypothetical protein